jgi:hypothetical protein
LEEALAGVEHVVARLVADVHGIAEDLRKASVSRAAVALWTRKRTQRRRCRPWRRAVGAEAFMAPTLGTAILIGAGRAGRASVMSGGRGAFSSIIVGTVEGAAAFLQVAHGDGAGKAVLRVHGAAGSGTALWNCAQVWSSRFFC